MIYAVGKTVNGRKLLKLERRDARNRGYWRVACSRCGSEHVLRTDDLRDVACGRTYRAKSSNHGMVGTGAYRSWASMMARCYTPSSSGFKHYGGRGIKVCDPWLEFLNFYADMGNRPEGKSLDRLDPNKDYGPDNCRWATPLQQAQTTRAALARRSA